MGVNIPETIKRLAKTGRIVFVHFRDVKGAAPKFIETWQDNGQVCLLFFITKKIGCQWVLYIMGFGNVLLTHL